MQESESGVNPQAKVTLEVSETQKAWLAGIIDGEGSIRIDYPRRAGNGAAPRVIITNNDWAIIERVADICKGLTCNPHISQRKGKNIQGKDVLILGMQKILRLLPAIIPYLTGQKLKQALLLQKFCEGRAKIDVNSLPNAQRGYSQDDILLIYQIQNLKHEVTKPQRLYTRQLVNDPYLKAGKIMGQAMAR